jgi:uncharacterized protein
MKCPVCDVGLLLAERQAVEIDCCPKCRGVWLDRGGLDVLIERSNALGYGPPPERGLYERPGARYPSEGHRGEQYHQKGPHREKYRDEPHGSRGRKRRSFLEDIFDFGD